MECLSFYIGDQAFGIQVDRIQDVLRDYTLCHVPLAPPEVLGSLNLRGRIVTAINVRERLKLSRSTDSADVISIVVFHGDDIFSLIVDRVGDVISLEPHDLESNPPTMGASLREFSKGVVRLQDKLMVLLDVDKIITF